jgi:hypothetical protein
MVYPNPVNSGTAAELLLKNIEPATLSLFDAASKLVAEITLNKRSGNNEQRVVLPILEKGFYLISLKTKSGMEYKSRLVVQ